MSERRRYGSGSLSQRTDKNGQRYYFAQLYLGVDPVSGKKRYRSKRFRNERAAQRWLREETDARHPSGPAAKATVSDLLDAWLARQQHRQEVVGSIKPATLAWYRQGVKRIRERLGDVEVANVRRSDIEGFLTHLATSKRKSQKKTAPGGQDLPAAESKPLSKATVRMTTIILRSAFRMGVDEGWLHKDPTAGIDLPHQNNEATPDRFWTMEQVRSFLDETADDQLGPLWRLFAVTGMRRGEALGLRWSDLELPDIGQPAVQIRRSYTLIDGMPVFETPKTDRSRRRLEIDQVTADKLVALRDQQRADWGPDWSADWPVFMRPDLVPMRPDTVTNIFQKTATKLGLRPIGPHGLRHSVATHLAGEGMAIAAVSALLGHASTRVTSEIYVHAFADAAGQAISQVAAAIDGA